MSNQKIIINANYKHEKRGGNYHVLLVANEKSENKRYPEKAVYIDEKQQVWCKNLDRFMNGMILMDDGKNTFLFNHNPDKKYPQPAEIFSHKNGIEYTVLYIANSHINSEDYPETVIYQNNQNGNIWAKTLIDFKEKMKKE